MTCPACSGELTYTDWILYGVCPDHLHQPVDTERSCFDADPYRPITTVRG